MIYNVFFFFLNITPSREPQSSVITIRFGLELIRECESCDDETTCFVCTEVFIREFYRSYLQNKVKQYLR